MELFVALRGNFATVHSGRKGTKSVSAATKWMCIIQKYAWRRKSDEKVSCRHIKGNVEEEAWENKAWEGGKQRKEEKEEEEKEENVEEQEEKETLPLFDVAGETKNGG
ncbi:hypothetical protein G5I_12582 [Acromyrmex echinatior]|uniref:Uncharacterized protein n=1 Tax=Acromyrmex echinatior TaxID=103372 RepID=F4X2Q1_ACREC|nr:hypothetical protein G5I_12582 [Acromyrmex echinatior]